MSKNTLVKRDDLLSLSLNDIEDYGSNIHLSISEQMTKMLHSTSCIDLEQTGKCLADLSVESDALTKKLQGKSKFLPVMKASKWLAKFDNIENRITNLEKGIEAEKLRLNSTLNGMFESLQFMRDELVNLEACASDLQYLVDYYTSNDEDDGLRLQAATNRLKLITTTIAVVKQECAKTVMIIKENKEVTAQLSEAVDNLIPILKVTMLNVIGAKTNEEALKLKKNLSKVANKTIVENAKQIERTAEELIEGRTKPLIEVSTITEANSILQSALNKVQSSASDEVKANLDAIKQLQDSINAINSNQLRLDVED